MLGPWLIPPCALWVVTSWAQEPLFLRFYEINILWGSVSGVAVTSFALGCLVWLLGRSRSTDWRWAWSRSPLAYVLNCGLGLILAGSALTMGLVGLAWALETTGRGAGGPSQPLSIAAAWLLATQPIAFLAPGIASLRSPTALVLVLWSLACAVGLMSVDWSPRGVSAANVAASMGAATGACLLSTFLVSVRR